MYIGLHENETIETALGFSGLLEASDIVLVTPTEKLMYIMTSFLGPDSKFLEANIKMLLKRKVDSIIPLQEQFNFETKLEGKKSFESLYSVFVDVFQGSSYGYDLFSILLMIPLAQKYDSKWRRRIWSEHVAIMRFVTCNEQQLFGGIQAYFLPNETDVGLLKCYHQALNSNILRENSIPHIIAQYHLQKFKEKRQQQKSIQEQSAMET